MKQLTLIALLLLGSQQASANVRSGFVGHIGDEFKELLIGIREETLTPAEARRTYQDILQRLHAEFPPSYQYATARQLIFPLKGYNYRAVGGNGTGFRAKNFNLFDHTVQGSHPAHDIFIPDRDQDCVDDRTGNYADVLAVASGIVLATETEWQLGMEYRGGNYVWLYDTETGGLWYYAHQREVMVWPGQWVEAGDKLAEVGRTGFNAAAKRSPTHLHLMYLQTNADFTPTPIDFYPWLLNATTYYTAKEANSSNVFMTVQRTFQQITMGSIVPKAYQYFTSSYAELPLRPITYRAAILPTNNKPRRRRF